MTLSTDLQTALDMHRRGRLQDALTHYNRVLAAAPDHLQALSASAVALQQLSIHDTAAARLERALVLDPENAQNWFCLALAREAQGRLDQAANALERAIGLNADAPELWNSLAGVNLARGRVDSAEVAARKATALAPCDAAPWFNLALSLRTLGRTDDALEAANEALRLAPDAAPPAGLKAQLQANLGRVSDARSTIDAAIACQPQVPALHIQAAEIELLGGHLAKAARRYESALALAPDDATVLSELLFLRKRLADWHDLDALRTRLRLAVAARRVVSPFGLLSEPSTRSEQRLSATQWSATFSSAARAETPRAISSGTLRIGYLSADFHQHATAVLSAGLFEAHDPRGFKIAAYSTGPDDGSPMRARLVAAFPQFVDASGWSAERLASRIRADGIDILVDLKGYTDGARTDVLALRPAPIQVNYLGYPGTMGASFVDYIISDRVITPNAHAADYSETLIQLPGSYQINDQRRVVVEPPIRSELGLPDKSLVLCCFNSAFKFNPQVLDAWARIMRETPDSVLWLLAGNADPACDVFAGNMRRELGSRGIATSRLIFAQRRAYPEYLGLYRRADLFLDTWPYNAHTTASDALWVGCPVLTWIGDTFAARVAASLLLAVGLPELIAPSLAHYVDQAIALAADRPALVRHRDYLLDGGRRSSLFDTRATTEALEAAYFEMAAQYRRGERTRVRIGHPQQ